MKSQRKPMPIKPRKSAGLPKVELVRGRSGQWHFRVRARNHEVVAHGETLVGDSSKARRAWRSLQRIARGQIDIVKVRGGSK